MEEEKKVPQETEQGQETKTKGVIDEVMDKLSEITELQYDMMETLEKKTKKMDASLDASKETIKLLEKVVSKLSKIETKSKAGKF